MGVEADLLSFGRMGGENREPAIRARRLESLFDHGHHTRGFDGIVDAPLSTPAPVSAWRVGQSYSIVIAHPYGTTIVQGSAGYLEGALSGIKADVVMLSVAMLEVLGRERTLRRLRRLVRHVSEGSDG